MDAWVYHTAGRQAEADALIDRLRASGDHAAVIPANSRYYRGEIHRGCVVYHDGSRRDLVWAHEREGVELRQFAGTPMEEGHALLPPLPPAPTQPTTESTAVSPTQTEVGDRVEQSGQWFTAYRNGQKLGKAQRSEDEAWALLGGRTPAGAPL